MSSIEEKTDSEGDQLDLFLTRFQDFVHDLSSEARAELGYEWAWSCTGKPELEEGIHPFHLGVSVLVHGDEVGPLAGLIDIMDALNSGRLSLRGRVTFFLGNPEAAQLGRRFVDVDLNRVITSVDHDELPADAPHEVKRAQALLPLLNQFDLYIDFHQTILESKQPFYICPWQEEGWRWMRLMGGASVWVTRHPEIGGGGLLCADEFVRRRGKPSVALELGERGFSAQSRAGVWRVLSRVISAMHTIARQEGTLEELSESQPELTFFETHTRYPFDDPRLTLSEGWVNFAPVTEGQVLTTNKEGPLARHASLKGALLFPKYPDRDETGAALEPRPIELCRVVIPLSEHPLRLWPAQTEPQEE